VTGSFSFERFVLDTGDRRLMADRLPVEVNGRYFDALALLVREQGKLVSKDRFLAEVWNGVPVTDEALTQCIKMLRKQLGDDASRPRFIETVPKHGYRFIAPVEVVGASEATAAKPFADHWLQFIVTGIAGTLGGLAAGIIGGLIYGFLAASQGVASGAGAFSILLVLLCITMVVGIIGAAGVSFAVATVAFARRQSWQWLTIAGAGGGLVTGALVKLLGIDAFTLLIGRAPNHITGAMEGLLLGGAVGLAAALARQSTHVRVATLLAGCAGAIAGIAIALLGGRLLLGSLAALTVDFPNSHLHVERIGGLFGEPQWGPLTQLVSAALEGALFAGCVVAAIELVRRGRVKT
jgi:DNA-binding winged helix-turn-helix (wHTH) protein